MSASNDMHPSRTAMLPDRTVQSRRLRRLLVVGIAVMAVAILLAYFGFATVSASVSTPSGSDGRAGIEMVMIGLLLVLPLGIGSVLAATGALVVLFPYSLRGLMMAVAISGVFMASWLLLVQPHLVERVHFDRAQGELGLMVLEPDRTALSSPGRWIARMYIVPWVPVAVVWALLGGLPILLLLPILRWRIRPTPRHRTRETP